MTGIQSYGVHIPRYHLTSEGYQDAVGRFQGRIDRKAVAPYDEDSITMAIDAARSLDVSRPDVLALAATHRPQPGTTASGLVIRSLGLEKTLRTVEFETSWQSGLEALDVGLRADSSLVLAGDDPRGAHDDPAEHVLGAGAAAFITGDEEPIAELVASEYFVDAYLPAKTDTSGVTDLDLGQYTVDGFREAVGTVIGNILETAELEPNDLDQVILPQDDVKTSWRRGLGLGFDSDQMSKGFLVKQIGFAGTAMPLIGLAAVLDECNPGDMILVSAYGYGHASIAFIFEATERVEEVSADVVSQLDSSQSISYDRYRHLTGGDD